VPTSYEASLSAMLSRSAAALRSCACAAACSHRCCWRLMVRLGPAMLELQDAARADARRSCSMSDSPANAALACTDGPADMLPLRRLHGAGAARGLSASAGAPRLSGIALSQRSAPSGRPLQPTCLLVSAGAQRSQHAFRLLRQVRLLYSGCLSEVRHG